MKPIINVEFTAKAAEREFKEEGVAFHTLEELYAYVSPGGGCEHIPGEVEEIQMVFLPPANPDPNPMANIPVTLELGMVFMTGPLAEISQAMQQLTDKAGRGELSESFLCIIGAKQLQ